MNDKKEKKQMNEVQRLFCIIIAMIASFTIVAMVYFLAPSDYATMSNSYTQTGGGAGDQALVTGGE